MLTRNHNLRTRTCTSNSRWLETSQYLRNHKQTTWWKWNNWNPWGDHRLQKLWRSRRIKSLIKQWKRIGSGRAYKSNWGRWIKKWKGGWRYCFTEIIWDVPSFQILYSFLWRKRKWILCVPLYQQDNLFSL